MRGVGRWLAGGALLVLGACAGLKAPTLQVEKLGRPHVGMTGGQLDVVFAVRNPNPEDLLIERFEYELELNGRRVGRGYVPEPLQLRGFDSATVRSRADLSFIRMPGAVKEILEDDRVRAKVKGHFYVRDGGRTRRLGFDSEARVDLR